MGVKVIFGRECCDARPDRATQRTLELVASVRRNYGGRGCGVWDDEPYPVLWPHGFSGLDEREVAELLGGTGRVPADLAARRPGAQRP